MSIVERELPHLTVTSADKWVAWARVARARVARVARARVAWARVAWARAARARVAWVARARRQPEIVTGVPSGGLISSTSFVIWSLGSRMHPLETSLPNESALFVPWMPMIGWPPLKESSTG